MSSSTDQIAQAEAEVTEYERLGYADDVDRALKQLADLDPATGAAWSAVVHDWNDSLYGYQVNGSADPTSLDGIPDDLPSGRDHVFVVLGNVLNADGTAKPELIDRLEVAKFAATKYPKSRILVTGGHTAGADKASEGEVMHDWLVAHGIPEDRIIVETESADTPDNATMSMPLLYALKGADRVSSISVITSRWHQRRGTILFDLESRLLQLQSAADGTDHGLITVDEGVSCVSANCENSGYVDPPAYPNAAERNLIAQNVAKVAGVTDAYNAFNAADTGTAGTRAALAKAVYLQQAGFAGDDAAPRTNTLDLRRAIGQTGGLSATLGAELPGFSAAWDAALRPLTVSATIPAGLPSLRHAFVLMGADSGVGQATTNRLDLAAEALARYPHSIVVVAGNQAELTADHDGLLARGVAADRIRLAAPSSNAPQGAVNAMNLLYGLDGAVRSYTLIVSGNYVRRPTVLFAAAEPTQRQARRADFRIVPTSRAIAETASAGAPDAGLATAAARQQIVDNVNEILLGSSSPSEYTRWTANPPTLSTPVALSVTATGRTRYRVGDTFDASGLGVSATLDDAGKRWTADASSLVTVTPPDLTTPGERQVTVTLTYDGTAVSTSYPVTVTAS